MFLCIKNLIDRDTVKNKKSTFIENAFNIIWGLVEEKNCRQITLKNVLQNFKWGCELS